MQTTFEEAKLCPKCNMPGEDQTPFPAPGRDGKKLVFVYCRNEECEWFNTNWIVQINADGSVPKAYEQLGDKKYPKLSPESETRMREAIERQLEAETQAGGAEIINPRFPT